MIEILSVRDADGDPIGKMTCESPSVYLDTCALVIIAEDPARRQQFVAVIKEKGGTLVLSPLSLLEFAGRDPRHAHEVGRMINEIAPNLYYQESRFEVVLNRQKEIAEGRGDGWPADADSESFRRLFTLVDTDPGKIKWGVLYETIEIGGQTLTDAYGTIQGHGWRIIEVLENSWPKFETSPFGKALIRSRRPNRPQPPRATYNFFVALMREFMGSRPKEITWNHGIDFAHAVVPIAYCDFVVLDKTWSGPVGQAIAAVRRAGFNAPMAKVYPCVPVGLDQLIAHLKAYAQAA